MLQSAIVCDMRIRVCVSGLFWGNSEWFYSVCISKQVYSGRTNPVALRRQLQNLDTATV